VTLKAPGGPAADWSTVVQTTGATRPQRLHFAAGAGMRQSRLHEWCTDLDSDDPARWFVRQPDHALTGAGTTVTIPPDSLCSLTTTTGQHHGTASAPGAVPMPLGYAVDTSGPPGTNPPLFFDVNGAFETTSCADGRTGTCIGQAVTGRPLPWSGAGNGIPTTLVGDPVWPGNYTVSASVLLQRAPWVELLGRVDGARGQAVSGYGLRLGADGRWQLASESAVRLTSRGNDHGAGHPVERVLASGRTAPPTGWQQLALRMTGNRLDAVVAGRTVAAVADAAHTDGQVGLRVASWDTAQFADLRVVPTEPPPQLVPASDLTVTASSERYDEHVDVDERAQRVLDGRPATLWTSAGSVDARHSATLTLTLRRPREVSALTVTPPRNGSLTGMVTSWRVETSTDGHVFSRASGGSWSPGTGARAVGLDGERPIRAVRLVITGSVGAYAAVAELRLVAGLAPPGPAG
jgi:hypothetical protein